MAIFPEKCNNCPFTKCRTLEFFRRNGGYITSKGVKHFFENYLVPQGKPRNYNESTPRKIVERLRKTRWIRKKFKESRKGKGRGRLAWVYQFDEKAKNYLRKYNSFLTGLLCRKKIGKEMREGNKVEIKPKIKEEIIIFGKE